MYHRGFQSDGGLPSREYYWINIFPPYMIQQEFTAFSNVTKQTLQKRVCLNVPSVTRVSEGCQIELRLIVVAMTEEDVNTELRCVTQNRGGRREVVAQLRLEGTSVCFVL